jgi:pseudaminic acid synthase
MVPIVAVSLGAKVIEKHFILDRKLGGPDAAFSLEPQEFKKMVEDVREAEEALGIVTYKLSKKTLTNRQFSRSLFVTKDMKKGEEFTNKNLRSIRPGFGILPKHLKQIIGKKSTRAIKRGTPLNKNFISDGPDN